MFKPYLLTRSNDRTDPHTRLAGELKDASYIFIRSAGEQKDLPYPFTKLRVRNSRQRKKIRLPPFVDQLPEGPFIDQQRSGNVTALVGRLATLNCRINQIGNKTVSAFTL